MKNKPLRHKEYNTFRFQPFSERISNINVDVFHRVKHAFEEETEEDTYLYQALEKWALLNCSEPFEELQREITSDVKILPQVLALKDHLVKVLLNHLAAKNPLSLQAALELTVALVKDLRNEFYPHYEAFLSQLISLLDTKNTEQLEWTFECLAYLFKFLWRQLVKNLPTVFEALLPLFSTTKPFYINNFAAESFSFVARKVKDQSKFIKLILKSLKKFPDGVNGCGRLLYEIVRGVPGQFHSCAEGTFNALLNSLGDCSLEHSLLYDVLANAVSHVVKGIKPNHSGLFWKIFQSFLRQYHTTWKSNKSDMSASNVLEMISFIHKAVEYKYCELVIEPNSLVNVCLALIEPEGQVNSEVVSLAVKVLSLLLLSPTLHLTQELASYIINSALSYLKEDMLILFISAILNYVSFEGLVLPCLLEFCMSQPPVNMLPLLTELIICKVPAAQTAHDLIQWSPYSLDLRTFKKNDPATFSQALVEMLSTNSIEDCINNHDRTMCILIVLPHLLPINKDLAFEKIKNIILLVCKEIKVEGSQLVSETSCNESEVDSTKTAVCIDLLCRAIESAIYLKPDSLANLIEPGMVISSLLSYITVPKYIGALRALNFYISSDEFNSVSPYIDSINDALMANLLSPYHKVRLLTTHILYEFEKVNIKANKRMLEVLENCWRAESIQASLDEYREKIKYMQKLVCNETFSSAIAKNEIDPHIPLRYLLGVLFVNFKLIWEPVIELISSYAHNLNHTQFWAIFGPQLIAVSHHIRNHVVEVKLTNHSEYDFLNKLLQNLNELDDKPDHVNYRILLWNCMEKFPEVCELKNRDISNEFLKFMEIEYFKRNADQARSWDIKLKDAKNDGGEGIDELDEDGNSDEEEEVIKKSLTAATEPSFRFRLVNKTLLAQLKVFSKLRNPKTIYREPELNVLYHDFLSHKLAHIQKAALDCLMTYKHKYLLPYRENLYRLIDDKSFKMEIVIFRVDTESDVVKADHRKELIPIVLRIAYSKMTSSVSIKTAGGNLKSNRFSRRAIVIKFLAGCSSEELHQFFLMSFHLFRNFVKDDAVEMIGNILDNLDLENIVPPKRLLSSVNLLNIFLTYCGGLLNSDLLALLLRILLVQASYVAGILSLREEVHPGYIRTMRNIRTVCFDAVIKFFEKFVSYPWKANEIDAIFKVFVWPWLDKLPLEGVHSPTPLLKLCILWSKDPLYFPLLGKCNEDTGAYILPKIMELWLNPKIHGSVYNTIMDIVERLLTLHRVPEEGESLTELPVNHMTAIDEEIIKDIKVTEELNFGSKLLIPFIPQILERLKQKLLTGSKQGLVKRDLEVMSRITELVSNSESSELMLNLLLPILHKKGNGSEYVVTPLLTTVFNLMRNISMPERYIKNLAPLFCKVNGVGNRKLLSEIVAELSKNGGSDSGLDINLLEDLNALDTKWVDQPDFNRRLDAFKKLEILLADHKVSVNMGVIVIYTCIYFLHTEKDLSLKDNASYCLKKLCPALCLEYRNNSLEKNYLVNEVILCLLKDGIKDKRNEFIRNESIALLGCMARECGELHPVLRDLSLLGNNTDLEVDFFENLQHLQLHRKVRAMLKFCELAKTLDKPPNTRTLTQFILPLVSYFLCSEKYTNKNTIIDASIQVLGTVCRLLPWHQYSTILSYYLGKLRSSFEYQKQLVRITVEILNSFHFDISQASLKKDESITVEDSSDVASNGCMDVHSGEKEDTSGTEVKHLLDVSEDATENSAEIELEEKLNAQDNEGTVEEIQTSSLKAIEKTTVLTRAGAVRVMQTITKNFLPSLNKSMAQRTQAETTHKLNRKLIGPDKDEEDILKVPLAIAAVKLLQKLPEGILDRNLPGILMKLCTFLKSRLDSVRRITRETLQTIMISIGPRYLSTLLGEMKALLTRGFHIHVLIYSIHSVLVALKPFFKEGDIGAVMPVLLNVCMMDLFGDTAEEKEVVQITGKTMEARANRAFDIFNIMATYISEGCLLDLILPLKEQMSKTLSHKNITKTSNCLQQVVLGLMDNKYIPVESLLEFAFGTSTESIPVLVSRLDEKPADPKIQELESRKQADTFLIPEEPKRQKAIESKTCVRTNAHILVEFGLRLIYFVLKREKLKNMDYKLYLDPLVQLFSNCLKSQHVKVSTLSIQCLCWIMKIDDLPSLRENIKDITGALFSILHKYGAAGLSKGDNFDLVMATFKAVAVLVRDVKYYIIEKKHMRALLLYCEQDLDDNSRRATAFSLLKAIVGRKIKTPELHEIILKVAKLSITSNTDAVRLQARQVVHSYLMEYPLGKKLDDYLAFYFSQLNYDLQPGRESAFEMISTIVNTFPIEILQEQSGVILINVGARLVNDEEPGCRKKAADIISSMLLRINYNTANKVFNIVELWMKDNKVALRRLAAQIVGIFVTCEKEKFEARLPVVLPLVVKQISDGSRDNQPGKFVRINSEPENDDMSSDDRLQDHHLYQILQMLIKVCSLCPKVLTDKKYTDDLEIIADNAHSLLAHPHEWVRFSSIQLLGLIVSKVPVADILAVANCESDETAGYLLNNTRYRLRTLVLDLSSQLFPGEFANEKFLMQCMKLLVCLADILKDVKDVENDDGLSLPWMVRRIRKQINIEITQAPTSTIVRTMCFNWIAAVALKFDKDELTSIVYHLMSPLVREINSVDESSSNLRQVAKEAANYIKKKIGSEEYNTLVLNLTTKLDIKRSERRNQRAQLVVTDPEKAAKRKISKHLKKRESKKRKVELMKTHKFKRKKSKDVEFDI